MITFCTLCFLLICKSHVFLKPNLKRHILSHYRSRIIAKTRDGELSFRQNNCFFVYFATQFALSFHELSQIYVIVATIYTNNTAFSCRT